jgi:hypothetical protein
LKCNTEKDEAGIILLLGDAHFVAFLEGSQLIPGLIFLILNSKLESLPVAILCGGIVLVEVKGVATARTVQLSESLKEVGLENSKRFTVQFTSGLKCDDSDKLCKELLEPNPLLVSIGEGFANATITSQAQKLTFNLDVLRDF